jgi:hypothetical protein
MQIPKLESKKFSILCTFKIEHHSQLGIIRGREYPELGFPLRWDSLLITFPAGNSSWRPKVGQRPQLGIPQTPPWLCVCWVGGGGGGGVRIKTRILIIDDRWNIQAIIQYAANFKPGFLGLISGSARRESSPRHSAYRATGEKGVGGIAWEYSEEPHAHIPFVGTGSASLHWKALTVTQTKVKLRKGLEGVQIGC